MNASLAALEEIKSAAARLGWAPSTLCLYAVRNGRIVKRLEAGDSITVDTLQRVREFIAAEEQRRERLKKFLEEEKRWERKARK